MAQNFSYVGVEQQYAIPMGAVGIRVMTWGGHGGAISNPSNPGFVDVTLDASQLIGPNLTVFVGQDGQQPAGGDGNTVGNGGSGGSSGFGGGAASYVKDSNGAYLVIGAGGGGDNLPFGTITVSKGGAGGGNAGNGVAGQNGPFVATGGGGGTQLAGGSAGSPGGSPGGSLPTGINVGGNGAFNGQPGGGGGGFYGGGGGGGDIIQPIIDGSGGGGGSNYHDVAKTLVLDANTSDPRVDPDGFITIIPIFAPCVAEGTLVKLQSGLEKPIEELRKGDLLFGNIPLEALIKFKTQARQFIRIPCGSKPFLIRCGHPILIGGQEVLPEALIGQMGIEEITTEEPTTIYTLITSRKEFVSIHEIPVATWSKSSWEHHISNFSNLSAFESF